jgi:hypothetical protein
LSVTPGNVGANKVLVELFGPERIQNFTIKFTPENPNFPGYTLFVPITRPGGALTTEEAGMNFKAPGLWTATITGVTTTGDLEPLTTTFVIADGTTVTTLPQQGLKVGTTTSPPTTVPHHGAHHCANYCSHRAPHGCPFGASGPSGHHAPTRITAFRPVSPTG